MGDGTKTLKIDYVGRGDALEMLFSPAGTFLKHPFYKPRMFKLHKRVVPEQLARNIGILQTVNELVKTYKPEGGSYGGTDKLNEHYVTYRCFIEKDKTAQLPEQEQLRMDFIDGIICENSDNGYFLYSTMSIERGFKEIFNFQARSDKAKLFYELRAEDDFLKEVDKLLDKHTKAAEKKIAEYV